jgi:hypothetical protein
MELILVLIPNFCEVKFEFAGQTECGVEVSGIGHAKHDRPCQYCWFRMDLW